MDRENELFFLYKIRLLVKNFNLIQFYFVVLRKIMRFFVCERIFWYFFQSTF